ncbi:MAG: response regulator [Tepidiformaceae bacterium]
MKILLAEDERTISRLISQVLISAGHEVHGVQSAAEAIARLAGGEYNLVLLDLHLADGDGFQVVDSMEGRFGTYPPIVIMTGERSFALDDPRASRVAGVLSKPFDLDQLEAAVRRFSA